MTSTPLDPIMDTIVSRFIRTTIDGCSRHAPYRGKKPPKTDCPSCAAVYEAVQALLESIEAAPSTKNTIFVSDPRCIYCGEEDTAHSEAQHLRALNDYRFGR
jgi:hypothetical protein